MEEEDKYLRSISITKTEIQSLYKYMTDHPNDEVFNIRQEFGNGIGIVTNVFVADKAETIEDITDYDAW